jgi:hypothetical protein
MLMDTKRLWARSCRCADALQGTDSSLWSSAEHGRHVHGRAGAIAGTRRQKLRALHGDGGPKGAAEARTRARGSHVRPAGDAANSPGKLLAGSGEEPGG